MDELAAIEVVAAVDVVAAIVVVVEVEVEAEVVVVWGAIAAVEVEVSPVDRDVPALPHPASTTAASISPTRIIDLGMPPVCAERRCGIRAKGPVRERKDVLASP